MMTPSDRPPPSRLIRFLRELRIGSGPVEPPAPAPPGVSPDDVGTARMRRRIPRPE